MTTFRQIEANRHNALKSTGPKTQAGKDQSRRNAVRHGLTAETVIGILEDAQDYREFEAAVISDYDAQSAVERELVLRLASVLWRLRRATTMETALFEIQAEHMREHQQGRKPLSESHDAIWTLFGPADAICPTAASRNRANKIEATAGSFVKTSDPNVKLAQCFLRLANLPNFALDRLNRYEAALWRQVTQILFALDALDRRKPQERVRCSRFGARLEVHGPNS